MGCGSSSVCGKANSAVAPAPKTPPLGEALTEGGSQRWLLGPGQAEQSVDGGSGSGSGGGSAAEGALGPKPEGDAWGGASLTLTAGPSPSPLQPLRLKKPASASDAGETGRTSGKGARRRDPPRSNSETSGESQEPPTPAVSMYEKLQHLPQAKAAPLQPLPPEVLPPLPGAAAAPERPGPSHSGGTAKPPKPGAPAGEGAKAVGQPVSFRLPEEKARPSAPRSRPSTRGSRQPRSSAGSRPPTPPVPGGSHRQLRISTDSCTPEPSQDGSWRETNDGVPAASEFGSLTGWQRIALDVMAEMENQIEGAAPAPDAPTEQRASVDGSDDGAAFIRWETIKARTGSSFTDDYVILEELGQGAYGKAFKAQRIKDGEVVVAKQVSTGGMSLREKLETKQEIKLLAHMDHPNVVKYYEAYAEETEMTIVMEFCEEGDLTKFLKKRKGKLLEEHQIMLRFVQICLALHHVHEKGILHRDLKASNIFCDTFSIVKLGDFGISKMMGAEAQCRTIVGTPYYLSPEICEDKPYGLKSDMWSLGCVLYELCTLRHAFDGKSLPQLVLKILSGKFPPISKKYSDDLKHLVNSLLAHNPEDRPDLMDIFRMPYVREHLHRYVIHIKKHITKRRESFKRSVAKWDPNYMTGYTDSIASSGAMDASKGLSGTIAKRQSSMLPGHHSPGPPSPVPEKRMRGTADSGESLSPRLVVRSSSSKKRVTIRESHDSSPSKQQSISGETSPVAGHDSAELGEPLNLDLAMGAKGLADALHLPPTRFGGEGEIPEEDGPAAAERAAPPVMADLLPGSRWSNLKEPAPSQDGQQPPTAPSPTEGHGGAAAAAAAPVSSREGAKLWKNSAPSSSRTLIGSAAAKENTLNVRRPSTAAVDGRRAPLDRESTIRRLVEAGAGPSTAAAIFEGLRSSLNTISADNLYSSFGSSISEGEEGSQMDYSSGFEGEEIIVDEEEDRQSEVGGDAEPPPAEGGGAPGARPPMLVAPPTEEPNRSVPLSPIRLGEPRLTRDISLKADARDGDGGGDTPQFRMSPPKDGGRSAGPPGAGIGPEQPEAAPGRWKGPFSEDDPAEGAAGPCAAQDAEGHGSSSHGDGPEAHHGSGGGSAAPQPGSNGSRDAEHRSSPLGRELPGGDPHELAEPRDQTGHHRSGYAEAKAEREAKAAAQAEAHRRQLLAAKEAREKAKAAAQHQAALWVQMLKKRVAAARPRVQAAREAPSPESPLPEGRVPGSSEPGDAMADPPSGQVSSDGAEDEVPGASLRELKDAGNHAAAMGRVFGLLDQVSELLEQPPGLTPTYSDYGSSFDADQLQSLEERANRLHAKARKLLGEEAYRQARDYLWDRMGAGQEGAPSAHDIQRGLGAIVGEANVVHLPLMLKAVRLSAACAEAGEEAER